MRALFQGPAAEQPRYERKDWQRRDECAGKDTILHHDELRGVMPRSSTYTTVAQLVYGDERS